MERKDLMINDLQNEIAQYKIEMNNLIETEVKKI